MGNGLQQGGHEAAGARHRDVAELGGGQRRERVMLHFEEACWAHVAGPLVELQPQPGPRRSLATCLLPVEELKEEHLEL